MSRASVAERFSRIERDLMRELRALKAELRRHEQLDTKRYKKIRRKRRKTTHKRTR